MKKSTAKAAKPTTPAKKAPVKAVKKVASVVKRTAASAVKAVKGKTPAAKAPAVKAAAKLPATTITALIDVGFGNTLYVRGEGPGLSWDAGIPLDCAADNKWTIALPNTGKAVIYKFLINDLTWSAGPDYVVESGSAVTIEPTF